MERTSTDIAVQVYVSCECTTLYCIQPDFCLKLFTLIVVVSHALDCIYLLSPYFHFLTGVLRGKLEVMISFSICPKKTHF